MRVGSGAGGGNVGSGAVGGNGKVPLGGGLGSTNHGSFMWPWFQHLKWVKFHEFLVHV